MKIGDDWGDFGFTATSESVFLSSTDAKVQQCTGAIAMSKPSGNFELHGELSWGDPDRGIEFRGGGTANIHDEDGNSLHVQSSHSSDGKGSVSIGYGREFESEAPSESTQKINREK